MGKLMKNGRPYGGHSTTAATVNYTDTHNIGATNTQEALDKVAQRVITQSAASGVSYTDTNNIGATNVQSAVDVLGNFTYENATLNSTYVSSGSVVYQKFGKVVVVTVQDVVFSATPSTNETLATGLPALANGFNAYLLIPRNNPVGPVVRISLDTTGTLHFHYTGTSVSTAQHYATFAYVCR